MALRVGDLAVGDYREMTLVDDLTRTQIVQYAGASGDFNPLHTDEIFAREVAGYPGVFAHGMLTMGMTGRVLTDWVGDGRLLGYGVRFVKQVWPGDTLTARAEVTEIRHDDGAPVAAFAVTTKNQSGDAVLTGTGVARLDPQLGGANSIEGGTSDIMRNILGERVLGLPPKPRSDKGIPWEDTARAIS